MNFNEKLNRSFHNSSRIIITIALVSMLAVRVFSTSSSMVSAFDLGSLDGVKSNSGINIGNLCFASDCTNQNIKDNQNSPVVTDSDNTNIESGAGGINQDPGLGTSDNPIEQCFITYGEINPQYFQSVKNFIGGIATDQVIIGIAISVGVPTPQTTTTCGIY